MVNLRTYKALLLLMLACWSTLSLASSQIENSQKTTTEQVSSDSNAQTIALTNSEKAAVWGLTSDEWDKFEALMQGPRGYWSPNLDPLTVLGIEAKTQAERMRYAELQAKAEYHRTEAELAYQRAYDTAFQTLFADQLIITSPEATEEDFPPLKQQSLPDELPLIVFVNIRCKPCDALIQRLQSEQKRIDVYVVDTQSDDKAIRDWAMRVGIKSDLVQRKFITLNHNNTELQTLSKTKDIKSVTLPIMFKRLGSQWSKVEL